MSDDGRGPGRHAPRSSLFGPTRGRRRSRGGAWTNRLAAELTLWQILHEEALEFAPPPALVDFHDRYLEALALLDSAASDLFVALDDGDRERLAQADDKIEQAIRLIRELDSANGPATPAVGTPASG